MGVEIGVGVAAVAANLIAGGMGKSAARVEAKKAVAAREQAMAALQAVGVPGIEAQRLLLENPRMVAEFMATREEADQQNASAFNSISEDPRLKAQQTSMLDAKKERAELGLTPSDIAELNMIRRSIGNQAQARDSSMVQNMQQRGMGGSGAEILSRMQGNQNAFQQQAEAGDRQAQMAFNAKQDAMNASFNATNNVIQQDFNQNATKATAQDAISRFNTQMRGDVQARNVAAQNQAQSANTGMRQGLENIRAQNANTQETHNKGLYQQEFDNNMRKAGGVAGQYNLSAAAHEANAGAIAQNYTNMGSGISSAITGVYGASQRRK